MGLCEICGRCILIRIQKKGGGQYDTNNKMFCEALSKIEVGSEIVACSHYVPREKKIPSVFDVNLPKFD
jgi:uncharacterized cysteine cluster protein YcgN (CxxCxxCC family)